MFLRKLRSWSCWHCVWDGEAFFLFSVFFCFLLRTRTATTKYEQKKRQLIKGNPQAAGSPSGLPFCRPAFLPRPPTPWWITEFWTERRWQCQCRHWNRKICCGYFANFIYSPHLQIHTQLRFPTSQNPVPHDIFLPLPTTYFPLRVSHLLIIF